MVSRKTMPTVAEDIDAQVAAGKENGVFLIDEYSRYGGDIQKALRTALNRDDHRLGNYNLPEGWIVVWTVLIVFRTTGSSSDAGSRW